MNVTPEKDVWLREGRTVYTLMHHGWIKGEEQFRNRLYFNLQYDHKTVTEKEAEEVAASIVTAISTHDQLAAALKDAISRMTSQLILLKCDEEFIAKETSVARAALAAAGEPV